MPRGKKPKSADEVIKAIRGSKGFVTAIARRLNVTTMTVYRLLKRYPTAQEALKEEREAMLDFAENALLSQIKAGNVASTIFFLKTQGKKRGYVERQETDITSGGQPLGLSLDEWKAKQKKTSNDTKGMLKDFKNYTSDELDE